MPKHAPPRRRLDGAIAKGRKYVANDHDRDSGSEDETPRLLPQLHSAVKRPAHATSTGVDSHGLAEPRWMNASVNRGLVTKKAARVVSRKPHSIAKSAAPHKLSLLDEQMLILCRSAIEHSWSTQQPQQPSPSKRVLGPESIYAATQVQRLFRGFKTRRRLAEADGPQYQRAASRIQFALRRVLVVRRVFKRWMNKRHRCATRIQAWYRGCRCRDQLQYERARFVVQCVRLLQRRYRGYRFWNLVAALLARRRNNSATQVQRCYRGLAARRRVEKLRQERMRFAQQLKSSSEFHRGQSRCDGCHPDRWTEDSLFTCFMVRFVGLHDFAGAKTLGMEGVRAFPTSARFSFMYSVLLQATGEDLDISMAFLRRAQVALKLTEDEVIKCEARFLLPALQICKNDIAVLLDLAVVSQCMEQITRAESFYRLALSQPPRDYAVPGYWHRVDMVDRLLLNYHRFCSIFKSRQVNVLSKVLPIAKRGEQIRVMVARLNRFTVIAPADEVNVCRFNAVYLTDEEVIG